MEKVKFVDGMEISVSVPSGTYIRTLKRWQKYGHDRLYIRDCGRTENYINLKTMEIESRPSQIYAWTKVILAKVKEMEF